MNKYFCVLPYFAQEIPIKTRKNIYCCKLKADTDIEEVRLSIKNKERSNACEACWKLEDSGLQSERQIHNATFDFLANQDLERVEEQVVAGNFSTRILKLHTSQVCNGTCVTCGSDSSTAWQKLEGRPILRTLLPQPILDDVDWENLLQLSFVGGEPLAEKQNFDILEKLLSAGNDQCFISFVTNGSIELNKRKLDTLSKFKNLNICLSIDGVGKSFEYMRYPLKWELLNENIKHFKKFTDNISVSCMISNLNILYYSQMCKFFDDQKLNYICRPITQPEYFNPNNLPLYIKKRILEKNPDYHNEVAHFLELDCKFNQELYNRCWQEIKRQDQLKNISIEQYLPEFTNLL